jgi:uncharacterized protein
MAQPPYPVTPADGAALARLAAATVGASLAGRLPPAEPPVSGVAGAGAGAGVGVGVGASFVTLEVGGRLRGCVGSVEAVRPLYLDVIRNAQRAMRDPRLPPLTPEEWPDLDVKVAVLAPAGGLPAGTREELLAALRPGVDGVLITDGSRRATFLPAVWAKLVTAERFVTALLAKGGWPPDGWPVGLIASRYTTTEYRDRPPREPLDRGLRQQRGGLR